MDVFGMVMSAELDEIAQLLMWSIGHKNSREIWKGIGKVSDFSGERDGRFR